MFVRDTFLVRREKEDGIFRLEKIKQQTTKDEIQHITSNANDDQHYKVNIRQLISKKTT